MKNLLALGLVMASFSSFAHGVKRLTTTSCVSKDSKSTVLVKFDSSITPLGPISVKINGEEVRIREELGSDYIGFSGTLGSKEEYSVVIRGEKNFETILEIAGAKTTLNCENVTKFRLY